MYSQVSDLGCLPSVTSIGAVCILVYVFFGTYVEVSVCILRKRETEREKDREREVGCHEVMGLDAMILVF